jgi:predicted nucleotidyltransferase
MLILQGSQGRVWEGQITQTSRIFTTFDYFCLYFERQLAQMMQIAIEYEKIESFCRQWKIQELALFGSVLSDEFRPDSDVDVLVTFTADMPWSVYDWIEMQENLQELFGRKVDLVDSQGLRNPYRRRAIWNRREIIYALPMSLGMP